MLHEETVERGTLALIKKISADDNLKDFILVGGTALALQIGHRRSVDIDLFNPKGFDSKVTAAYLQNRYNAEEGTAIKNALFTRIDGIKVDIVSHRYNWLQPSREIENIRMASLDDIAAMKLNAIVGNGTRLKDFVDLYALLEYRTLEQLTNAYTERYPDMNATIAKNALLYHEEIKFKNKVDFVKRDLKWPEIAERLKQAVLQPKKSFELKNELSIKPPTDEPARR